MSTTRKKLFISFLYDTYADKVLGFIIGQNYSKEEGEILLVKVFAEAWHRLDSFRKKEKRDHLLLLLKIAANIIYQEKNLNTTPFLFKKTDHEIPVTRTRFYFARLKSRS